LTELAGENRSKKNTNKQKKKEGPNGRNVKVNNKQKAAGTGKRKKKATADVETEQPWVCALCKGVYGDSSDKLPTDDWFPCVACRNKFHFMCRRLQTD